MVPELIKYFNCVAVTPDEKLFNPEEVNLLACRCGYLVHPDACTKDVVSFLESRKSNFNTTFYKSWTDVDSLREAEMKVLQLIHYLSTYGTDYEGKTFTMNDFPVEMRFHNFTILMPCTEEELFERISHMFETGIALNSQTLDEIFDQVRIFKKKYGWKLDPDRINNREAKAQYYIYEHIFPYDPFELMRIFMFTVKQNALIINDKRTFESIYENLADLVDVFSRLDEKHFESLATVFYRYKKILLYIRWAARCRTNRSAKELIPIINHIRRLARKLHKPFTPTVLGSVLASGHTIGEIKKSIERETSVFILVRLLNYLNIEKSGPACRLFKIRNGKIFIKAAKDNKKTDVGKIDEIIGDVKAQISKLLKPKAFHADGTALTVRFPEYLDLAAPVSEKMFIGSVPYGSKYLLGTNNYIGIYWRNEWGTRDFDLWMVGKDGIRIGWSADHKTTYLLFSGDMTNADPEATEIMYCRGIWPDCTIRVLRYNGVAGSRFRLFFGSDDLKELPRNYMVDPDTIRFTEDLISESTETTVGIVYEHTVYFASLGLGSKLIPSSADGSSISYEQALFDNFSTYTPLRDILLSAGFEEFKNGQEGNPDIDLSGNIDKDTLISLLSV